jgi:Tfp pilus assembly protein PilX
MGSRHSSFERRRRGVASALAMLFLILVSVLALGFYGSATVAIEVSRNDVKVSRAQLAAESGMQFLRFHLRQVVLTAGTPQNQVLQTVATQLSTRLNGTLNMGTRTVGYTTGGSVISIPSLSNQYISFDGAGTSFRAEIRQSGTQLQVTVKGRDNTGGMARAIQLNYTAVPDDTSVFGYGLATKGSVTLSGGILNGVPDSARGSFFSTSSAASPLTMSGSANISGQVYFTSASGTVSGSGTIDNVSNPALWGPLIHTSTAAPEFPSVDTSAYAAYLVGKETIITGSTSATPLSNIRIKAGANPNFSGGGTYKGVIYIEAPNKVTFSGAAKITGVIVVDNPNETTSTNTIIFSGGSTLTGPENLDASYGELRSMTGASIIAPNFSVSLSGGSSSFGGSVLAKSVSASGGSGGTVNGSVLAYGTASTTYSGGSGFTFSNSVNVLPSVGLSFTGHFFAVLPSYQEVAP